jgi:hypothetical protein
LLHVRQDSVIVGRVGPECRLGRVCRDMSPSIVIEVLRGLADLTENFPDNARPGRGLPLGGGALFCAIFVPDTSPNRGSLILILKSLGAVTGAVCMILGSFVFFGRWVCKRQEKQPPTVTSIRWK